MKSDIDIKRLKNEEILGINEDKDFFKVILIEKGNGVVNFSNTKKFFLAPAVIYLNESEEINIKTNVDIQAKVILFHPSMINNNFVDFGVIRKIKYKNEYNTDLGFLMPFIDSEKTEKAINLSNIDYNNVVSVFKNIEKYSLSENDFRGIKIKSLILDLLVYIIEFSYNNQKEENRLDNNLNEIDDIIMYLQQNYNEKITIADITKLFNMNRTTLSKKFLSYTGKTIIEYVTELRIKKFINYLEEGKNTIYQAMTICGFNDIAHFNRTFHKHMGCSPTEYKKLHTYS